MFSNSNSDIIDINNTYFELDLNNIGENSEDDDDSSLEEDSKIFPELNYMSNDKLNKLIDENTFLENKKNEFIYYINHYLDFNLNNLCNIKNILSKPIFLGIYKINYSYKYPFLEYLFEKDYFNLLSFPTIKINNTNNIKTNIEKQVSNKFCQIKLSSFKINGFSEYEDKIIIFIDSGNNEILINNYNSYLVLMDEIVNNKHVNNIKIDTFFPKYFIEHFDLIYLKDENNNNYEIPVVVYQGIEERLIEFTVMFGNTKSSETELMGPYFYFTSFENVQNKFNSIGLKYAIIRYGIFLGTMKIPMNFIDDEEDYSIIKENLLSLNDNYKHLLTKRISDHSGKWTDLYDSVYIGRTELDDGSFLNNTPIWVIKDYSQQITLSYNKIYPKIKFIQ
jgi:hypothetical protein